MLQMRKYYYPEGIEYMRRTLRVYEIYVPAETPRIESKVVLFTLNSKLYMYVQVAIIIANHFNII